MAVMVRSQHPPEAFKREVLQAIERDLGRVKGSAEVVADLDIVLIDERVMTYLAHHPRSRRFRAGFRLGAPRRNRA
jgi:7,8-dihydro-6-hydroxymethylpterin-pyrophosphokinase